jgi:hypothetical protein
LAVLVSRFFLYSKKNRRTPGRREREREGEREREKEREREHTHKRGLFDF